MRPSRFKEESEMSDEITYTFDEALLGDVSLWPFSVKIHNPINRTTKVYTFPGCTMGDAVQWRFFGNVLRYRKNDDKKWQSAVEEAA
jgi:hypothetical protein